MSETIDKKVVEMRFDNQNFEKNVSQTMETSKKLSDSLTNLEKNKSLETLNKNAKQVDFSHMSNGVEKVRASFSTMEAVGFSVINRLTNKAMDFGKSLVSNTVGLIKSGGVKRALNLEQAGFQVKGLAKDVMASNKEFKKADDVWNALLEDVNYAVDGTAYGLDEASKVGSQLMASNVKMGKEMKTALRGVSGMAAMTGRTYSDIGNIYTKIAGNGRMMSKELLQFSASGINAASTLTKYVNKNADVRKALIEKGLGSKQGKVVKEFAKSTELTEQNIRTLVSAGVVDFKTFSKAMDDAFGEHATKANETYTGSLSNLKAALARVGEPIATNTFDTLKKVFNTLTPIINGMKKELGPLMDFINGFVSGIGKKFTDKLNELTIIKEKIDGKETITGIAEVHDRIVKITETIKKVIRFITDVAKTIYNFRIVIDPIKKIFADIKKLISDVFSSDKAKAMDNVQKGSSKIAEFLRNILIIIEFLIRKISPFITVVLKKGFVVIGAIATAIFKVVESLKNVVKYIDYIKQRKTVQNVKKATTTLQILKAVIKNIFKAFSPVIEKFKEFGNKMKDAVKKGNLFSILLKNIKGLFNDLYDLVSNNKKDILNTGLLAGFTIFYKQVKEFLAKNDITKKVEDFANKFSKIFTTISASITKFTKAQTKALNAKAFKDFAISMALIAASLFVVAGIPYNKLMTAIKGLSIMIIELGIIFIIINKTISKKDLANTISKSFFIALVMTSLGSAIVMLAIALKIIGGLNMPNLIASAVVVFVLLITLTTIVKRLVKSTEGVDAKSVAILWILTKIYKAIAKAMVIIAISLKILATCDIKSLAVSAVITFGILLLLSRSVNKLLKYTKELSPKDAVQISAYSGIIKSISRSILIIAAALKIMTAESLDKLVVASIVVLSMMGSLVNIVSKLAKLSGKANGKELGKLFGYSLIFIALSKIVTSISKSLDRIAKYDFKNLAGATFSLMLIIHQLLKAIDKLGQYTISMKTVASVLVLSLLMFTISEGLSNIAKFDPKNLIASAIAMAVLIKFITKFVQTITELELNIKGLMAFKAIAKLISAMAGAIKTLSTIDFPGILFGMGAMVGLLIVISTFVKHIGSMKISAKDIAALLAVSAVLFIIASSTKLLAGISLAEGAIAIGLLIAMAAAVMVLALAARVIRPFLGVLAKFGFVLIELGAAMFLAGVGMAQLAIGLAGLVAIGPKGIDTLIEMYAQLMAASTIYSIKYKEVILNALISLFDLIIDFLEKAIPKLQVIIPPLLQLVSDTIPLVLDLLVDNIPIIANAILDMIIGILNVVASRVGELLGAIWNVLGAIGKVITDALGQISPEGIIKIITAIGLLAIVFFALDKIKASIAKALISIALMSVGLLMLTGVFAIMSKIPMNIAKTLNSISKFLITMGIVMIACALLPAPAAISAVISLGIFVGGLSALLIAFGAISQIPGFKWLVGKGGELLELLAEIIGNTISAFLKALSNGFPAMMANFTKGLIILSDGLAAFGLAVQKIPKTAIFRVASVIEAVGAAIIGGTLNKILKFFLNGDPIKEFSDGLEKLSGGLKKFADGIKGINLKAMQVCADVIKAMALVLTAQTMGGMLDFLGGTKTDFKSFASGLDSIAVAIQGFRSKMSEIKDADELNPALDLIVKVCEMANSIPKTGGLAGFLFGETDADQFAKDLSTVAKVINSLKEKTKKITEDDIKRMSSLMEVIKAYSKTTKLLPTDMTYYDYAYERVGTAFKNVSKAFVDISDSLSDVNLSDLDMFVDMMSTVSKAYEKFANAGVKNDKKKDKEGQTYTDPMTKAVKSLKDSLAELKELGQNNDYINTLTDAEIVFNQIHAFIWRIGPQFANSKTAAYANAIKDVSKSIKSIADALRAVNNLKLTNVKLKDTTSMKDDILSGSLSVTNIDGGIKKAKEKTNNMSNAVNKNKFTELADGLKSFVSSMKEVSLPEIKETADKIKLFTNIKDFKEVKFGNFKDSIKKLHDATDEIQELGKDKKGKKIKYYDKNGDPTGAAKSLDNYKKHVVDVVNKFKDIEKVIKGTDSKNSKKLDAKSLSNFSDMSKNFASSLKQVADAFVKMESTDTIKNSGAKIKTTMETIASSSVGGFLKAVKKGVGTDSEGNTVTIKSSFNSFAKKIKKSIKGLKTTGDGSIYQSLYSVGTYVMDGLIAGISDKSDELTKAIKKAAKDVIKGAEITLEIASPSKVFKRIGRFTIEGYIKGVENGKLKMIKSTKKVFSSMIKGIKADLVKNNKTINSLGKSFGKSISKNFGISGKKGNYIAKRRLVNAAEYLYKQTDSYKEDRKALKSAANKFNKNQKKINDYEKKHHLKGLKATLKQKQAATNKAKKAYDKIDSKKENKAAKSAAKKRYEAAKKAEDAVAKKYDKATKKVNKYKDKRNDTAQSMKDAQKQATQNMINALIEFRNTIKDNIKSYLDMSSLSTDLGVDMFSEFSKQSYISPEKMIAMNKKNVEAVKQYQNDLKKLDSLVKKGQLSASVVRELKAGGISKWAEVKAYLSMDSKQLNEVNTAWKERDKLTATQMSTEINDKLALVKKNSKDLEKLRKRGFSTAGIQSIAQMAPEEQRKYLDALLSANKSTFNSISKAYKKIDKVAKAESKNVVLTFASTGAGGKKALEKELNKKTGKQASTNVAAGLSEGIISKKQRLGAQYASLGTYIYTKFNDSLGIHSPSTKFKQSAKYMCDGLKQGVSEKTADVKKAFRTLGEKARKACGKELTVNDGKNLARPIVKGIKDYLNKETTADDFKDCGVNLSGRLVEGIQKGLSDKKSKKKTTRKIRDLCKSIGDAFSDFFEVNSPSKVTARIGAALPEGLGVGIEKEGNTAISSAKRLSSNVLTVLDNMSDDMTDVSEPVLTPVIDLTNVESAANDIDSMLNNDILMKASLGFDKVQNGKKNIQPQQVVNNYNNNFEQNNYSPEPLSRTDIYRDTKSVIARTWEGGLATS